MDILSVLDISNEIPRCKVWPPYLVHKNKKAIVMNSKQINNRQKPDYVEEKCREEISLSGER